MYISQGRGHVQPRTTATLMQKISRNSPYRDGGQSETRRCLVLLCEADGERIQLLPTFTKGGKALGLRNNAVLRTNAQVRRLGTRVLSNRRNKVCR